MKKLLAMLSAAVTAIGLQAATYPSGTDFNGESWPDANEAKLWTTNEFSRSDVAYTYSSADFKGGEEWLPAQFTDTAAGANLKIETGPTSPIYRAIKVGEDGETPVAQDIGENGVLVDTLVKFTAYDDEDADFAAMDPDAKFAVWIKEVEGEEGAEPTYQLMVTAGKLNSDGDIVGSANYTCTLNENLAANFSLANWVRLTVKTIADFTDGYNIPGFVVCVNGLVVTSANAASDIKAAGLALSSIGQGWLSQNAIFPALIKNDKTVKQVGFVGTGWIDDLSITDTIPAFIEDASKAWTNILGEPDTDGAYKIDDATDLLAFAKHVNGADVDALATAGVTFKLTADIALTIPEDGSASIAGIGIPNAKELLSAEGYSTYKAGAFKGTFDGGNFTISNVILPRTDYAGLFMSAYGATIRNLKVSLGNATGFATATTLTDAETAANGDYGGGVILGVSVNTTVENCQTVVAGEYNTFKAPKALAGIVGYAGGATVIKNCTNNLAISSENTKVGGIAAILQTGVGPAAENYNGATVEGCTNNGNISTTAGSSSMAAGLVSYVQMNLTIKGTCAQNGTVTGNPAFSIISRYDRTITVDAAAAITTTQTDQLAANTTIDGLTFATVSEGTATFLANSAVTVAGAYKVMASGAAFTLAKEGDSITFDTSLATATVEMSSDFSSDDYEITEAADVENEKVITYTLAKKTTVKPVTPGVDTPCENEAAADALAKKINGSKDTLINVPTELTADQKTDYLALIAAKVVTTTPEGGTTTYSVVVDLTTAAEETIQSQVDADTKALKLSTVAKEETKQTLTTKPGIYYSVIAGATLDGMDVRSSAIATGETLEVTLPHYQGAGFYKIKATVNQQKVVAE